MPRLAVVHIPLNDLTSIFDALGILNKINRQQFIEEIANDVPAKSPIARGGRSYILKYRRRSDNTHTVTTHVLRTPEGETVQWHGKHILLGETKFATEEEVYFAPAGPDIP